MEKAIITLFFHYNNKHIDVEVPLSISAKDFIVAINETYRLNIDTDNIDKCFLRCENPIALLKGDKTLKQYKVRNGSRINIL